MPSPRRGASSEDAHPSALSAAPMTVDGRATRSPDRGALYRRWRAQRFAELIGQEPIVTTLRQSVITDRLAHAYLFIGPRGTGKTSTARILAKAINCLARTDDGEPCDACGACVAIREGRALDVIEIDAASHGLVEDARDLVMRALTAPSELRKRVYIIDEVHMLSTHAFNALLKLVEEPPDHVVFILATTDTHKVPATIISRTQRFDFRRLADDLIAGKLARIVAAEGRDAEPAALALVARLAEGGMRDAESILDQVMSYTPGAISADAVRETVGLAEEEAIDALIDAYLAGDTALALGRIDELVAAGRDVAQVAGQAQDVARRRLLASAREPLRARRLAAILRSLSEAAGSGAREGRARLILELLSVESAAADALPGADAAAATAVVAADGPARPAPPTRGVNRIPVAIERATDAPAARAISEPAPREPRAASPEPPSPPMSPAGDGSRPSLEELRIRWAEVVDRGTPVIKPLLRECRPFALDGARLKLAFPEGREFMRERISSRAAAIEQLLGAIFGQSWAIECVATNVELEPLTLAAAVAPDPADANGRALLEGVLKITGGELVDTPEVR
ncbi:MAG: DNA polymerase III subunit gamma/tau [Chloroflexi bacterium]|nr:MAG: DNA polymerase III subunit gamma/tau [Chloroflexota bacterium]